MISIPITNLSLYYYKKIGPLIPTMTSNTTPQGIASANINNSTAYQAFTNTGWSASSTPTITYISQYQFSTPRIVTGFVASLGGSSNLSWNSLEASNDGTSWVVIALGNPFFGPEVPTTNIGQYTYFRILLNGAGNSTLDSLIWQLYGYS